jgi:hypothetical protein
MRYPSVPVSGRLRGLSVVKVIALAAIAIGALGTTASAVTVYNRTAAVAYADANWNKVVSDGYFWINGSTANYYGAGQPVPVNVSGEASGIGDDCAHFVSSVLGTPAGGLTIPSRAGTYGEPGAARLDELLVGNSAGEYGTKYEYGQLVSSVSQLTPGDVIGYDWDGSGGGSMSGIDHTVVYVGNGLVDCHATSHLGVDWKLGGADDYFFIHITLPDSIVPSTPSNVFPATNTVVANTTPTLAASAFSDGAIGSTQTAAEWEIFKGSTLVYDSGSDIVHFSSINVPSGKLSLGTSYTWKVRYEDSYGDWSSYSAASTLKVMLPGDYNNNGIVDEGDYAVWRASQGTTRVLPNDPLGGTIGAAQFTQWRSHFGMSAAGGSDVGGSGLSGGTVPEPSLAAYVAGLLLLFVRRGDAANR